MLTVNERPFSLDHIVGQKGIISEFKERSKKKDYPSVMIFAGQSGTGKTTLANIIAALINDENPIDRGDFLDPNPETPSSRAILEEKYSRDTSFYDASRMSKDDILKLEELVSTEPMFDNNRVIILDEAQELSKTSKGAALKLLEKKRKNTYIILCTMNPEAFDSSIRGRGLYYAFRSPTTTEIATNLFSLAERIGKVLPDEFLETGIFSIADNCEGSVRMSVQMLERCIAGGFYSAEQIEAEFGVISNSRLYDIIKGLVAKDKSQFGSLKKMDPKDFYYAASKFLSEAVIYLRVGHVEASWKEQQFKALVPIKNSVFDLFNLFSSIDREMGYPFKPSYFLARLTEIYEDKETVRTEQKPAAAPVAEVRTR